MGTTLNIQSNPVYTDTEGAMESVRIKQVEYRKNLRAFVPQGQRKQTLACNIGVRIKWVSLRRGLTVLVS